MSSAIYPPQHAFGKLFWPKLRELVQRFLANGAIAFRPQFLAVKVALARRESGVKYPSMYAEGNSEAAVRFNCTQRAHLNTLEYLPNVLALQMLMGLQYPVTAAALGAAWTLGRLIYAAGYSSGDPAKRAPGSTLAGVVYLALIGGCAYAGFRMLA